MCFVLFLVRNGRGGPWLAFRLRSASVLHGSVLADLRLIPGNLIAGREIDTAPPHPSTILAVRVGRRTTVHTEPDCAAKEHLLGCIMTCVSDEVSPIVD